jgi:predicted esterase
MRMRAVLLCLALMGCAAHAAAQKVVQVRWETAHASPPVKLGGSAGDWLPAFRLGLQTLPEAAIVALSLSQPQMLGLAKPDAEKLQRLTAERYKLMSGDALFQRAPTALPYCYSETKPAEGLATVYVPKEVTPETPCIVFLHGYGGSFLWCLHVLVEAFPEAVIVCPAYGMSTGSIPAAYVKEALTKSASVIKVPLKTPVLMGLSAGGFGACKVYVESPMEWRRLICLAAYAPDTVLTKFEKGMDVCFLAGGREDFVSNGYFNRGVQQARTRGVQVRAKLIPETGHFFLLESREESLSILKEWMR